jgi:hypothetical protein
MMQSVTYASHTARVPDKVNIKSAPAIFRLIPNPQTATAEFDRAAGRPYAFEQPTGV